MFYKIGLIGSLLLATLGNSVAADWHPGKASLMTRWAAEVGPTNALPDYPRPQLVRTNWLNLNGLWNYVITPDSVAQPASFTGKILVPFPVESALSGVMTNLDEHSRLWYRRQFSVPETWRGQRVRLHFGAVDWRCQVWVNSHEIGQHQGGYDAFTFDITDALQWKGAEEITVCVTDPTEGDQPRGKQSRKPEGIFYTATSGIWQTVWLEPVPAVCIDRLRLTPDLPGRALRLRVAVNDRSDRLRVEAVAYAGGQEAGRVAGPPNTVLTLMLPDPKLWSPDDPFLYDLKVELKDGGKVLDSVTSYFGMREVALRKNEQGFTEIALNGQFVFELGALDQGYWPDGLYTAPTDTALRWDLEFLKQAGFNLVRKHVKVEPARWYYWCDKLGLLVWQDMPSGNNTTPAGRRDFENELMRMVAGLENHPSVVAWVLFNEDWGEYDTKSLADWLKQRDPSRLVDNASGWTDAGAGDLIDMHNYPGPDSPAPEPQRAAVLGEFGGLGLAVTNHLWASNSWAYVMFDSARDLETRYAQQLQEVWRLHYFRGLSAAVFTQNTDVETESDGLQTYDRAVAKVPPEKLRQINLSGRQEAPRKVILADAFNGRVKWKFTIRQPADNWYQPAFSDADWAEGVGGFGTTETPGVFLNTAWATGDIWLRRDFELSQADLAAGRTAFKLHVFHDEGAEIYLNGMLAARLTGFVTEYGEYEISSVAASTLRAGTNTIAVHCHQTTGGQGIDVGIVLMRPVSLQKPGQ